MAFREERRRKGETASGNVTSKQPTLSYKKKNDGIKLGKRKRYRRKERVEETDKVRKQ